MNFKKLSMASIGLAAFLFSCGGGKVEYSRDMMKSEIDGKYDEQATKEKYAAGKKVKAVETLGEVTDDYTYTLDGKITTDEDGFHVISLKKSEEAEESLSMPILDDTTLSKLPTSAKFYKINNGYLMSAAEGTIVGDITFGKDFVCTSMEATIDGQKMTATFTYIG